MSNAWDRDLENDLKSPTFRKVYEETRAEIRMSRMSLPADLPFTHRSRRFVAVIHPSIDGAIYLAVVVFELVPTEIVYEDDFVMKSDDPQPVGYAAIDARGRWIDMSDTTKTTWPYGLETVAKKTVMKWHAGQEGPR